MSRVIAARATRESRAPSLIHPRLHILQHTEDGYAASYGHLVFIVSESKEDDGHWWRHGSVSIQHGEGKGLPTYNDLKTLQELCMPQDRPSVQMFMPKEKHVDIANRWNLEVLHLWACLDAELFPDFTSGTGSI